MTDVRIEWAPQPAREYLGDRTSFDAAVEYVTASGERGFLGVETKLTEPFSARAYDTGRYRELTELPGSPWPPRSWSRLADTRWNQLWRNHLLVEAVRRHPGSPITGPARLLVVRHPGGHECQRALSGYRALTNGDGVLVDLPLDRLDDVIGPALTADHEQRWWAAFRQRYVDLSGSAGAR